MKLIHSADLHVGANRSFDPEATRAQAAVTELLGLLHSERPRVLVISGDLLDHAQPTHEERAIIADLFAHSPVPIVAITGTHDRYGKEYHEHTLNWLTPMAHRLGHRVFYKPTAEKFEGCWWLAIPFGGWQQTDLDVITAVLADQVPRAYNGPVVGVSHEFYRGAGTDLGFVGDRNKYPSIPLCDRIDYWALGDVHRFQRLAGTKAWYSGSMYQTDFGERRPKGVLLVDVTRPRPQFVELTSVKPLIELTAVPRTWPDAYVKLSVPADKIPSPLPPCVVSVRTRSIQAPLDADIEISADNPLRGLATWLRAKKQLPPDQVKLAMRWARKLREQAA